jgi:thioredoxin-like negative regulator of GroEL
MNKLNLKIEEITDEDYQQRFQENEKNVIFFYAEWCQSCRFILPKLVKVCQKYDLACFVADVKLNEVLRKKVAIHSLPKTSLWDKGECIDVFATVREVELEKFLKKARFV